MAIPDNDPGGVSDSIVICESGSIVDLNVSVDIAHTWVGDIKVTLTHEDSSTSINLIDRPGAPPDLSSCAGLDIDATLDDEAATPVEDECAAAVPTIDGTFIPNQALAAFDGESIGGTWTLNVTDDGGGLSGTLDEWCLIYDTAPFKWSQEPDVTTNGVDVGGTNLFESLGNFEIGDDFLCTMTGPITGISIYSSWFQDIVDPYADFEISIWEDHPTNPASPYSTPTNRLCTYFFDMMDYTLTAWTNVTLGEWFYDPFPDFSPGPDIATGIPAADSVIWKYDFVIDESTFPCMVTQQQGNIYWITARYLCGSGSPLAWGWKSSTNIFNDDAVWRINFGSNMSMGWIELFYPANHPYAGQSMDLAFEVRTRPTTTSTTTTSSSTTFPTTSSTTSTTTTTTSTTTLLRATAWEKERQIPVGTTKNSSWDDRTFRVLLEGNAITNGGNMVCLTLLGRFDSASYTIQRVSLVKRDGNTLDGVDSTWAKFTFGAGSWDDGATVPPGAKIKSHFVPFELVPGEDVFVTFWAGPDQKTILRKIGGQTMTWVVEGEDESETIDWEALTIDDMRKQTFAACLLDVLTGTVTSTTSTTSTSTTSTTTSTTTSSTSTTSTSTTSTTSTTGGTRITAWEKEDQIPVGITRDSSWDNRSFRVLLEGTSVTNSGCAVCVTLLGRNKGPSYTIQRVSLVKRDGNTLNGIDETLAKFTFGAGAWNDGATVPPGAKVKSHFAPFDLVEGEDLFLSFWAGPDQKTILRKIGGQTMAWVIEGVDESETVDWQLLPISDTRKQTFAICLLDVLPGVSTTTTTSTTTTSSTSPIVPTEFPVEPTACPPMATQCPPSQTACPTVPTACPPSATECPPNQTECPPSPTECPPSLTACPSSPTECPPMLTQCPVATTPTMCMEVPTDCPTNPTECPPSLTSCPSSPTECPPMLTQCPVPTAPTMCMEVPTDCPTIPTECPVMGTMCPMTPTSCPELPTMCPMTPTSCPEVPNMCPP